MTTVAMNNLDLSKIKRSKSNAELTGMLAEYIRSDERLRAECQRQGKPIPNVRAQQKD
ncbi:hypothetical protein V2K55_03100 [Pseudomonas alliivorans]|uniref:Uncharacterized protein n=1 Tax=Pseudomonas syringae pv. maculicola TaxID=59511 RepID=A0A3M2ZSP5_PSEYM|nr:hypothetical protein [Pseudomonas syringae group genomosp. 3]MEE4704674.1 hypothetical protein [Pseudomonas alliivorans]MEE4775912.1 hypothetical protein [Pseudomonas alliivorans]RML91183.1 hypothetical protein APX70_03104 [Pseudomonas syringae pv. maculicola]